MKKLFQSLILMVCGLIVSGAQAEVRITQVSNAINTPVKLTMQGPGIRLKKECISGPIAGAFSIPEVDGSESYIDIGTRLFRIKLVRHGQRVAIVGREIYRENGTFRASSRQHTLLDVPYNAAENIDVELRVVNNTISLNVIRNTMPTPAAQVATQMQNLAIQAMQHHNNVASSSSSSSSSSAVTQAAQSSASASTPSANDCCIICDEICQPSDRLGGQEVCYHRGCFLAQKDVQAAYLDNPSRISSRAHEKSELEEDTSVPMCNMCGNAINSHEDWNESNGITFHEACAREQARAEQEYEKNNKGKERDDEVSSSSSSSSQEGKEPQELKECQICFDEKEMVTLSCGHEYCSECLEAQLDNVLRDKNSAAFTCPDLNCKAASGERTKLTESDARKITDNKKKIADLCTILTIESLANGDTIWRCPTADCPNMMINDDPNVTRVHCPGCKQEYCAKCSGKHSDRITCADAKLAEDKGAANKASEDWVKQNTKQCPKCKTNIEKNGGCKHMTCSKAGCRYEFCWDCLQQWTHLTHPSFFACPNPAPANNSSTSTLHAPAQPAEHAARIPNPLRNGVTRDGLYQMMHPHIRAVVDRLHFSQLDDVYAQLRSEVAAMPNVAVLGRTLSPAEYAGLRNIVSNGATRILDASIHEEQHLERRLNDGVRETIMLRLRTVQEWDRFIRGLRNYVAQDEDIRRLNTLTQNQEINDRVSDIAIAVYTDLFLNAH